MGGCSEGQPRKANWLITINSLILIAGLDAHPNPKQSCSQISINLKWNIPVPLIIFPFYRTYGWEEMCNTQLLNNPER